MSQFQILPGSLSAALDKTVARLAEVRFADALWSKRLAAWTSDAATQRIIANRLGWLDVIDVVTPHVPRLRAVADSVRAAGFTDIVLLGMGGSSLAPEVLRQVIGVSPGFPRFRMLDSVDPEAVRRAMANAATSLFVYASKSGGTIEPRVLAAEARRCIEAAGVADWGSRFVAITDENTALHTQAQAERFREIFVNPSDIGGRYSALSFFGMVPAALMGIDLDLLLNRAREMAQACRGTDPRDNPGLALGAVMGAAALNGRDKLTLLLPDRLASFGWWVEQLVAESTGKQGTGVVPISGERPDAAGGADRVFVAVHVGGDSPSAEERASIRAAGAPIVDVHMPDVLSLGAEFFRWEVATATAGLLLDINPFDEPNVQQAKDATRVLLESFTAQGRLPAGAPHASVDRVALTLSAAAREALDARPPAGFLHLLQPRDYFGLLAYLPPDDEAFAAALADIRSRVGAASGCATMLGYGPRYLHSTGQLHKGGANTGVFVVITAPAPEDLSIPGEPYSFSVLEMAQALGDFQSLDRTGRRALHIDLPERDPALLRRIFETLLQNQSGLV